MLLKVCSREQAASLLQLLSAISRPGLPSRALVRLLLNRDVQLGLRYLKQIYSTAR